MTELSKEESLAYAEFQSMLDAHSFKAPLEGELIKGKENNDKQYSGTRDTSNRHYRWNKQRLWILKDRFKTRCSHLDHKRRPEENEA